VIVALAVRFGSTRLIDNTIVELDIHQEQRESQRGTT